MLRGTYKSTSIDQRVSIMLNETELPGEQLEDAFRLFNRLSEKLSISYSELETQVSHLSEELAEARSERHKQLVEKELLAVRLEGLLNTLPAGIVVLDSEGCINQVNPIAQNMLGINLLGQSWKFIAQQVFITDGDELRLRDGRWVSVSARPLDAEPGKIILVTDVTEIHTLQDMLNRQQRLTSLGEMVAGLAHQIRTPLAAALLYLSNLCHPQAKDADKLRCVDKTKKQLHHLERIVNDMLIFARGGVTESECFTVGQIMGKLQQLLEPVFLESKATLLINNQIPDAPLRGNCDALLAAFQNLANNAIQACDEDPVFEINVNWSIDEAVEFSFIDNGSGMTDDIKGRVLEPFFTTRSSGTGLGLAVVNATVASHHGKFDIQSEEGVGSCFTIKIPLPGQHGVLPSDLTSMNSDVSLSLISSEDKDYNSNYFHNNKETMI